MTKQQLENRVAELEGVIGEIDDVLIDRTHEIGPYVKIITLEVCERLVEILSPHRGGEVVAVLDKVWCHECGDLHDGNHCYLHNSPRTGHAVTEPVTVTVRKREE